MNLLTLQPWLATVLWLILTIIPASATTIEADRMVAEQQQKRAIFEGNVTLVTDELHLFSNRLVAYYQDHLGGAIDHAKASGKVRIRHKKTTGSADRAILDQKRDLLTLTGHAELTEQGRLIRGGRIEHHLKSGNTTVSEGKQGQRVHIHIDDDNQRSFQP